MIKDGETFVDTWTSPWGTFTDSTDQEPPSSSSGSSRPMASASDRPSADPPLSMSIAEAINYGQGDPVKEAYLQVLAAAAKPQVFVPPGVEAWDAAEVLRQLTIGADRREAHPGRDGRRDPDGAGPRVDRVGEARPVTA